MQSEAIDAALLLDASAERDSQAIQSAADGLCADYIEYKCDESGDSTTAAGA
ncbi:hypothetical protein [Allochromatium warmingii]|uniref:hypothetical protein n=1 Tax=Allochromatium warmingii TaxID=61595 RepID=UPI0015A64AE0|nr:hypothetical protein [Allochromatium warmingii]